MDLFPTLTLWHLEKGMNSHQYRFLLIRNPKTIGDGINFRLYHAELTALSFILFSHILEAFSRVSSCASCQMVNDIQCNSYHWVSFDRDNDWSFHNFIFTLIKMSERRIIGPISLVKFVTNGGENGVVLERYVKEDQKF